MKVNPSERPANGPNSPLGRETLAKESSPFRRIVRRQLESGASQFPEISGPASPSGPQAQNFDAVNECMSCPLPIVPLSSPSASLASSRVPDTPKVRRTDPASKLPSVEETRVSPFTKEPIRFLPLGSKWIWNGTFREP